jgi:8-oxo-dGTP pyrophosphatase MutT (NUDIX family)
MADELPPAIPAATVIVIRDGATGLETLMLRKNAKLAFGGMWVFPGGRVDAEDGEGEDGPRRAAVREALEEAALVVDPGTLVPFSHWTPPAGAPKRFATWFFLAPAPEGGEVTIDGGEIHEHEWVNPATLLARHGAGEVELAPPTWVSLHRLADATDVDSAMAAARAATVEAYETHLAKSDDGSLVVVWHGDVAYKAATSSAPGPRHRLDITKPPWIYERDT